MSAVQPHTIAVAVLVIAFILLLLLRSLRVVGVLIAVGAVLGVVVGATAIALVGHLV